MLNWYSRNTLQAAKATLLLLRRLLDNYAYHSALIAAVFVSYQLLKYRSEIIIDKATAFHEKEMIRIRQEHSVSDTAKDLEISSLETQKRSQQLREEHLLQQVTGLESQVTESKKKVTELEKQVTKCKKETTDLAAQLKEKASKQEAIAAKAINDRKLTEAMASQQRVFADEARQHVMTLEQEASVAKAGKAGTSSEALEGQRAAEHQVEVLKGEIVAHLEEKNALRASLSPDHETPKTRSQEGDSKGEVESKDTVDLTQSLGPPSDPAKLPPARPRVRCNRRPDGSIRTAKHPLATPPKQPQPGIKKQRPVDEQGALDRERRAWMKGQNEVDGSLGAKKVRRPCPFFPLGTCKFGDRCFDAHVL